MTTFADAVKVMVGSTPAVAVYAGAQKVWPLGPPPVEYNDATGGDVTEYAKPDGTLWRVHTFTKDDTLTVTKTGKPWRVLVVGGGGPGGTGCPNGWGGGGGGGAVFHDEAHTLPLGGTPVVVGGGVYNNGDYHPNAGQTGGTSSLGAITVGGGGPGGTGAWNGKKPQGGGGGGSAGTNGTGGSGGDGSTDNNPPGTGADGQGAGLNDITGTAVYYGGGGDSPGWDKAPGHGGPKAGPSNPQASNGSLAGVVIVSYEIKPPVNNDVTPSGGVTVVDVNNYLGSGKTYRVATFTASGTLSVKSSDKPFNVLTIGGGAGAGGDSGSNNEGSWGGAGGQVVTTKDATLPVGDLTVEILPGGPGGWPGGTNYGGAVNVKSGDTVLFTSAGGQTGPSGPGNWPDPATGHPGVWSDVSGKNEQYASGGGTEGGAQGAYTVGYGNGGGGTSGHPPRGGGSGAVIVAWEIDAPPFNDATGGTITEIDNYNGTGEKWRVHTFAGAAAAGKFTVKAATQPFRWIATGGGGGCGWTEGNNSSGGGNAASAVGNDVTFVVGDYAVNPGNGGANGQYSVDVGNYPSGGGNGGTTTFTAPDGTVLASCGGGQGGQYNGGNRGGGSPFDSNITGTNVTYCNGPRNSDLTYGAGSTAYTGMGPYSGPAGGAGVVIVAYRIG